MQFKDKPNHKLKEKENSILALLFIGIFMLAAALAFDYYYDLNDDSAIRDILSGAYTGTPNGHNIQMLYGIGVLLALPYRLVRSIPWFGLFLCLCQYGCFYLIAVRSLQFCKKRSAKILLLAVEGAFMTAAFLYQLIFVQYTVVSGVLAATAVFLFYTSDAGVTWKKFLRQNAVSILLVLLSFGVRTEMLLLLFPLICLAGLFKWAKEKNIFQKENFLKYGMVLGVMLAGMLLLVVTDRAAYAGTDWKEFRAFFDARTKLYDFAQIPSYEEHREFYEKIGVTEEQQALLLNYNFGLDEELDAARMEQIAEYAAEQKILQKPANVRLKESLYEYKYRLQNEPEKDMPWNLFVAVGYLLVTITALTLRDKSYLWKLPLLAAFRSALWIFILYNGRVVERITIPLLMTEFVILIAMLFVEYHIAGQQGKAQQSATQLSKPQLSACIGLRYTCAGLIAGMALACAAGSVREVAAESARREEVNTQYTALQEYLAAHPDNYYFFDVFSSVAYSEKLFADTDSTLTNFDLMGGWICKSPLYREKLAQFGITSMQEAIVQEENVYILCRLDRPEADMQWLQDFYGACGREVVITGVDTILVDGRNVFGVYTIDLKSKKSSCIIS